LQVIQQDNNPNACYFFARWGRVGVKGQTSKIGPTSMNAAIGEYNRKFHEKHNKGDYEEIALNFENDDKDDKDDVNSQSKAVKNNQNDFDQSKLPPTVKKLI
jgi:predicted DNA-binding WGR domain protein